MKIAIIGAGIGGLTAAALLQEQGHTIKVFEKNESVKEIGAGIGIGDNVLKKLGNHDLAKGIKNAGQILSTMTVLDDKDRPLTTVKLKSNTLNVTLPRQTLIDIIKSYVKDDAIFTNHEVTHIEIMRQIKLPYISRNKRVKHLIYVLVLMEFILK